MNINNNNYSVMEIIQMLDRRELIVNKDYQRASGIWPPSPSSYFTETILEGFPFPKIYLYEFLDRQARGVKKEIVDGQQRINTIKRYYNNEFSISGEGIYSGRKFEQLHPDDQEKFLTYSVPVDVIRNADRSQILQMFRRMNAYTMPLNEAEKRHSEFQGSFKWFVNSITDELNEFFIEFGIFSERQIIRMSDSAMIADIILSLEKGIISSSPKSLTILYKQYDELFPNKIVYRTYIIEAIEYIRDNFGELRKTFMMKPYAFHSLMTALIYNRHGIRQISEDWNVRPRDIFSYDPVASCQQLLALAQAHEASEVNGPYATYVWGASSTTDRKLRRTARVAAILRALGVQVPEAVDADLA